MRAHGCRSLTVCGGGCGRSAGIAALPRNASEKLGEGKLPPPMRKGAVTKSINMAPKKEKRRIKGYIVNTATFYNAGEKKNPSNNRS